MRLDAPAPSGLLSRSGVNVWLFPDATPQQLLRGTATNGFDCSHLVATCSHTESGATVRLNYRPGSFPEGHKPASGHLISIRLGSFVCFNGIVESVADRVARPGERSLTLTVRRRDGFPYWRELRRVTDFFAVGTDLSEMAGTLLSSMGLAADEYVIPFSGISLVHDRWQFTDRNAWDILEEILQPALCEPFVDALGRLRVITRNVNRPADITVPAERLVELTTAASRPALTAMRVKWLDRDLAIARQNERVLATASATCGFFCPSTTLDVWWSSDHTLRAENLHFNRKQSINDGLIIGKLIRVGEESFDEDAHGPFGGKIKVWIDGYVPGLATVELGLWVGFHALPDMVTGIGIAGITIPWGRVIEGFAGGVLLTTMMKIGFGVYEITGVAYDYVQQTNVLTAYDKHAPEWETRIQELESNLIPDQATAETVAVGELIYRAREANKASLVIADDLRIEPGDILSLPDSQRFYVTGYERELTRGADAVLKLDGFLA